MPYPCCCPTCLIFSDDFNRGDSSDLGSDWTETTGNWEISSNALSPPAGTDTLVTCNSARPNNQVTVKVKLFAVTTNDEFKIVAAGHTAVIRRGRVWIFEGASQEATESFSGALFPVSTFTQFTFCVSAYGAAITVGPDVSDTPLAWASTAGATSGACGLGMAAVHAGSGNQFDDFQMLNHQHDVNKCFSCDIEGCNYCQVNTSELLQVEIEGFVSGGYPTGADGCDCVDYNGTWLVPLASALSCRWEFVIGDVCTPGDDCFSPAAIGCRLDGSGNMCVHLSDSVATDCTEASFCSNGTFQGTSPMGTPCDEWDEVDVPIRATASSLCRDSGNQSATCKVTAIG